MMSPQIGIACSTASIRVEEFGEGLVPLDVAAVEDPPCVRLPVAQIGT
jgi:hypothetical protein